METNGKKGKKEDLYCSRFRRTQRPTQISRVREFWIGPRSGVSWRIRPRGWIWPAPYALTSPFPTHARTYLFSLYYHRWNNHAEQDGDAIRKIGISLSPTSYPTFRLFPHSRRYATRGTDEFPPSLISSANLPRADLFDLIPKSYTGRFTNRFIRHLRLHFRRIIIPWSLLGFSQPRLWNYTYVR